MLVNVSKIIIFNNKQDVMTEQDIPKYFEPLFEYFEERRKKYE